MKGLARRVLPPILAFCVLICVYAAVHGALGTQPFAHSNYDSYTLQALAWREGRVSLGQDYPHLELAVYEGDFRGEEGLAAAIARIEALAWELGFARVVRLSPKEHDAIIGYVSQLTHAIAVSLMLANDDPRLPLFTGDSFRDLTRIARIDETLWSELFLHNRDALLQQIDRFSAALAQLREQVAAENEAGLKAMFRISSQRRSWLNQPQQPGSR